LQASWAHPTPATCTRVLEARLAPAPIGAQLALFVLRSHNCYCSTLLLLVLVLQSFKIAIWIRVELIFELHFINN
jgi:hypothetical protein